MAVAIAVAVSAAWTFRAVGCLSTAAVTPWVRVCIKVDMSHTSPWDT